MGEILGKLFVTPSHLPGGKVWHEVCNVAIQGHKTTYGLPEEVKEDFGCDSNAFEGFVQVLFLLFAYGYVLFNASNLISEGSELLLLVPSLRHIVGSIVLPVLGAVPDGAIVLFSGLGPDAQEQLSIGVGALAGSTIMLLTVPWFLSIFAGRVNITNGRATYRRPPGAGRNWSKLMPPNNMSLTGTGVEAKASVRMSAIIMLITMLTYLVIQVPAFLSGAYTKINDTPPNTEKAAKFERWWAFFGLIVCLGFFGGNLWYQAVRPEDEEFVDQIKQNAINKHVINLSAAFYDDLQKMAATEDTALLADPKAKQRLRSFLRTFFNRYDYDRNGCIDRKEFSMLMRDLGEMVDNETLEKLIREMDTDNNGQIDFEEFASQMPAFIRARGQQGAQNALRAVDFSYHGPSENNSAVIEDNEEEEEEEEEVPDDLKHEDPEQQLANVKKRAFYMMGLGTVLVLLFSDPMVDVLSEIGERIGIPGFYISFVLAPLASNASELLASYNYALKKTTKTITIAFSALEGAAIMNNTFVLAIFLILVFVRNLAWEFSAETIAIIFVELVMTGMAMKRTQTILDGLFILSLFPISIALVAILENVVGLD
eukprot:Clim_evm4s221 gene=Clim_evmTU4s221